MNFESTIVSFRSGGISYNGAVSSPIVAHGMGTQKHPDGKIFTGEFDQGRLHRGVCIYPNGNTYVGGFVDFRRSGWGTLVTRLVTTSCYWRDDEPIDDQYRVQSTGVIVVDTPAREQHPASGLVINAQNSAVSIYSSAHHRYTTRINLVLPRPEVVLEERIEPSEIVAVRKRARTPAVNVPPAAAPAVNVPTIVGE